jgi:hypothetical protein
MRPVVIALFDPPSDADPCFLQAAVLCCPDFLFFQAFDVAIAFRVMIGRPRCVMAYTFVMSDCQI